MNNKDIQKIRMRNYFIQATREIILSEGLKAVSVRNIARKAGYSYATLYNYFKNAEELVFESVGIFSEECTLFVASQTEAMEKGTERLEKICKAYMDYFIQYPGIYELFYLEKMTDKTLSGINILLEELCKEDLDVMGRSGIIYDRALLMDQLNYCSAGLLLYYLRRYVPAEYSDFIQRRDKLLKKIIKSLT